MPWLALRIAVQASAAFLASTLAFDVVHAVLHLGDRRPGRLAAALTRVHRAHHAFLDADLTVHDERWRRNVLLQHLPEAGSVLLGTLALARLLHPVALALVLTAHIAMLARRVASRGRDWHHQPLARVLRPWSGWFVGRDYHALHHLHPQHHLGSALTLVDRLLGTTHPVDGRTFALVGDRPQVLEAFARGLELRGGNPERLPGTPAALLDEPWQVDAELAGADALVLAPGPDASSAHAAVLVLERFRALRRGALQVPEVWLVLPDDDDALAGVGRALHLERTVSAFLLWSAPASPAVEGARVAWALTAADHGARVVPTGGLSARLRARLRLALRWRAQTPRAYLTGRGLRVEEARPRLQERVLA